MPAAPPPQTHGPSRGVPLLAQNQPLASRCLATWTPCGPTGKAATAGDGAVNSVEPRSASTNRTRAVSNDTHHRNMPTNTACGVFRSRTRLSNWSNAATLSAFSRLMSLDMALNDTNAGRTKTLHGLRSCTRPRAVTQPMTSRHPRHRRTIPPLDPSTSPAPVVPNGNRACIPIAWTP